MGAAKVFMHLPTLCDPACPPPEALWSGELAGYYYEQYRAAGSTQMDEAAWRHSFDLELVAQSIHPYPWAAGGALRALDGRAPLPKFHGMPDEVMRMALGVGMQNTRRTVDLIALATGRCGLLMA